MMAQIHRQAAELRAHPAPAVLPMYTVRAGDTMSGIALRKCTNPSFWTGIYAASRAEHLTGVNANQISVGQHLAISCHYVPADLKYAPAVIVLRHYTVPYRVPVTTTASYGSERSYTPQRTYSAPVQRSYPSRSGVNWNAIAQCESGGNWSISTGNGYYGGLQFTQNTWDAYGGGAYAPSANQASPSQQMEVAGRVLAGQGIGAWPVCGSRG